MKICFLMALADRGPRNPVMVETVRRLRDRGVVVDLWFADQTCCALQQPVVGHDLYVLKSRSHYWFSVAQLLAGAGGRVRDDLGARQVVGNKALLARALSVAGVPTPETWLTADRQHIASLLARFPLVVKPVFGEKGRGIHLLQTPADLASFVVPEEPVVIQRFHLSCGPDLKVYAIGRELFGRRKAFHAESWREPGTPVPVPDDASVAVLRCGETLGLSLFGVDLIETETGFQVIDLNWFPSYRDIAEAPEVLASHLIWEGSRAISS